MCESTRAQLHSIDNRRSFLAPCALRMGEWFVTGEIELWSCNVGGNLDEDPRLLQNTSRTVSILTLLVKDASLGVCFLKT